MKKKSMVIWLAILLMVVGSLSLVAYTVEPAIGKAKEYWLNIGDDTTEEFVLYFDENGGENLVDIVAADGAEITLPTCKRLGYNFICWTTASGTEYKAGDTFTLTADTTLTAKWEEAPVLYGDVNGDGNVNAADRTILARYIAKWSGYTAESIVMEAADVNCDGNVNAADRTILARYIAKWSGYKELPYID